MARCKPVDALSLTILNSDLPESASNECLHVHAGPVLSLQCLHEDSFDEVLNENFDDNEKHPHLMSVKIADVNDGSSMITSASSPPQSSIPAMNSWEGTHNFKIKIECIPRKYQSPVFSEELQKLYIDKDHPFKVLVHAENVPKGSLIKATAVFAMIEHSNEIVQRCPTHAQADISDGNPAYEHFVQCHSDAAVYSRNPESGKLSVSVPYEMPQKGENFTAYIFTLTCFSSCSGGISRRPFMLVFTLEKDNIPLGRQAIGARVCSCPLEDFKIDRELEHRKRLGTERSIKPSSTSSEDIFYDLLIAPQVMYNR